MQPTEFVQGLFKYIQDSPTPFHAVKNSEEILSLNGFQRLDETASWQGLVPGAYYVTRNRSSLIAFNLTHAPHPNQTLRMAGAHTDSPCLKVKPQPLVCNQSCIQIGVEVYGGALLNPWFDRDLSLAGRLTWKSQQGSIQSGLIDFKRPVALIPSLAIHLDREANNSRSINKQTDIVPLALLAHDDIKPDFHALLKEQLDIEYPANQAASILDFDLFFYDAQPPAHVGFNKEFLTGARFDNLLSCYALLEAATMSTAPQDFLVVLNDNEETGSVSTTGAQGSFLQSVLERIYPDPAHRVRVTSRSLFISVDNAHAVHPNFPTQHEGNHLPKLNRGPVLKKNANQRYASNSVTSGLFKLICEKTEVPVQEFVMRNDMACGSTIGPLTAAAIGVPTVDIGVPSLAMHSIRETVGNLDGWYLFEALSGFFQEELDQLRCQDV